MSCYVQIAEMNWMMTITVIIAWNLSMRIGILIQWSITEMKYVLTAHTGASVRMAGLMECTADGATDKPIPTIPVLSL